MGLRINTNVSALAVMRNLSATSTGLAKTMERLSTGLRINHAADDAAGLAISEGLQSQVRGLTVASRNASDGISIVQTAEGAMSEQATIVQRLRELSIQAANGTLSSQDRESLQEEVDGLLTEFDRIATQTSFNGVSLLNGFFGTRDVQVGVNKNETIDLAMINARSTSMGAVATKAGAQRTGTSSLTAFDEVAINSTTLTASALQDDGVSYGDANISAISFKNAINAISGTTGVSASIEATVVTAANTFSAGSFTYDQTDSNAQLLINGIAITGSGSTISDAVSMINQFRAQTGVSASVQGSYIVLSASDGRNITMQSGTDATPAQVDNLGLLSTSAQSKIFAAAITLSSDDSFTVSMGSGGADQTSDVFGVASGAYSVSSSNNSVATISLLTQNNASDALEVLDNTLRQISKARSKLGATQNRLETAMRNLNVGIENLSAANARFRDADIALETGSLTKSQILQQAGVSVLSQTQVSTQSAISLLQ